MRRLGSVLAWDVRLQLRQGFYAAAAFVVAVWLALLWALPADTVAWLLPIAILGNVLTNTFYFLGGLVLLEKREGTLEALVVTPLRPFEYLASKVLTLTALSLAENLTIAGLTHGAAVRWPPLVLGIVVASALFALAGFLVVVRYDTINEYLMPSVLYTTLLCLPFFTYFGLGSPALLRWHPTEAALELMRAAFPRGGVEPSAWSLAYGIAFGGLSIAGAFWLCRRAFDRFVVAREGAGGRA